MEELSFHIKTLFTVCVYINLQICQGLTRLRHTAFSLWPEINFLPDGSSTDVLVLLQGYNYTHLSAGDLLREERARVGSEYGQLIDDHIKEGKIVPVSITISLLRKV